MLVKVPKNVFNLSVFWNTCSHYVAMEGLILALNLAIRKISINLILKQKELSQLNDKFKGFLV